MNVSAPYHYPRTWHVEERSALRGGTNAALIRVENTGDDVWFVRLEFPKLSFVVRKYLNEEQARERYVSDADRFLSTACEFYAATAPKTLQQEQTK